jgi:aminopeptidase N
VNSSTLEFNIYGGYTGAVYNLGAVLLEDLEREMGHERFRELMHRYTETYRFKTATTADFVRMAQQVAGRDLSAFFRAHKIDLTAREAYRPVMPLGAVWPG